MENKQLKGKALTEEDLGMVQGAGSDAQQAALLDDMGKVVGDASSTPHKHKEAQDFFGGLKKEK